ncbi:MAG TPA: hypothetical protein VGM82_23290 [Gemmatimonadaceae bacterium]|jgi:hypothetical protein
MKQTGAVTLLTIGLILWVHQLPTIGGRVPLVFVVAWFGAAAIVALIFAQPSHTRLDAAPLPVLEGAEAEWRARMHQSARWLLPFALVPLLERRGVRSDPAVWLLDAAPIIALTTVPYFTGVARTAFGGAVLSVGAFQAVWTCGASALFVVMKHSAAASGAPLPDGGTFEDFFRPEYRYLFLGLSAVMVFGYCPALLRLGHRRFVGRHERGARSSPPLAASR